MNDNFKYYIASKVPKSKFFIFQHGGSYHTQGIKLTDLIEYRTCDKFLTWGWREKKNNKKLIPMFNPKNLNYNYKRKVKEKILIQLILIFPQVKDMFMDCREFKKILKNILKIYKIL